MLLKDRRIFIVEDNLQNRVIFQVILMHHGAIAIFERWGRDTLARLGNTTHVDLILLDLMLADGISGLDIFDSIRAVPQFSSVPIAAVSAMDAAVAIPQVRSKGFSAFIAKPIDNHLFPKQLEAVIRGEQVWDRGESLIS